MQVEKKGWLHKRGAVVRNWRKRWFVLAQHSLVYFDSPQAKRPKGAIELKYCTLQSNNTDSVTGKEFSFILKERSASCGGTDRDWWVRGENEEERKSWVSSLSLSFSQWEQNETKDIEGKEKHLVLLSDEEVSLRESPGRESELSKSLGSEPNERSQEKSVKIVRIGEEKEDTRVHIIEGYCGEDQEKDKPTEPEEGEGGEKKQSLQNEKEGEPEVEEKKGKKGKRVNKNKYSILMWEKKLAGISSTWISDTERYKLFGIRLETLLEREKQLGMPVDESSVPAIASILMDHIEKFGGKEKGIFRIPGSQDDMNFLRQRWESGEKISLSQYAACKDIHNIAGLLKMFIRELPDPLLTHDAYPMLILTQKQEDEDDRKAGFEEIIKLLPTSHRALLRRLLQMLHNLLVHAHVTEMTSNNLAIVFAPNLLKSERGDLLTTMRDAPYTMSITRYLIEHYLDLFPESAHNQGVKAVENEEAKKLSEEKTVEQDKVVAESSTERESEKKENKKDTEGGEERKEEEITAEKDNQDPREEKQNERQGKDKEEKHEESDSTLNSTVDELKGAEPSEEKDKDKAAVDEKNSTGEQQVTKEENREVRVTENEKGEQGKQEKPNNEEKSSEAHNKAEHMQKKGEPETITTDKVLQEADKVANESGEQVKVMLRSSSHSKQRRDIDWVRGGVRDRGVTESVHLTVSEDTDGHSESDGEGPSRKREPRQKGSRERGGGIDFNFIKQRCGTARDEKFMPKSSVTGEDSAGALVSKDEERAEQHATAEGGEKTEGDRGEKDEDEDEGEVKEETKVVSDGENGGGVKQEEEPKEKTNERSLIDILKKNEEEVSELLKEVDAVLSTDS